MCVCDGGGHTHLVGKSVAQLPPRFQDGLAAGGRVLPAGSLPQGQLGLLELLHLAGLLQIRKDRLQTQLWEHEEMPGVSRDALCLAARSLSSPSADLTHTTILRARDRIFERKVEVKINMKVIENVKRKEHKVKICDGLCAGIRRDAKSAPVSARPM